MRLHKRQRAFRPTLTWPRTNDVTATIRTTDAPSSEATTITEPISASTPAAVRGATSVSGLTGKVSVTDEEREKMLAAQVWIARRVIRIRQLMCFEVGLLVVALMGACLAQSQWFFCLWAVAEVALVWYHWVDCQSWQGVLYRLKFDLTDGGVRESVGHVRSVSIHWRIIEDDSTGARYQIVSAAVCPSMLKPGTEVVFLATIRSRIVLSLSEKTD